MDYITLNDVKTKLFNQFKEETRQIYIDKANLELEDLAILKGVAISDIKQPIHFKLKDYCVHYAVVQLALDNSGFNTDANTQEDKYERGFQRETYVLQGIHSSITSVMFTGEVETPENRAVISQRIVRG